MKLLFLSVLTFVLLAEIKSSPLGQDGKKDDLLVKCLIEVLSKAVSKPDDTSLQPECKDILQKQASIHSLLTKNNENEHQEMESNDRAQKMINGLLKAIEEGHEDLNDERSQEEFPNYYKRHYILTSKERREDPENERSQEEFPNYYKRHYILTSKEKREDPDNDRSQEEFPQKRFFTKEKRDYQDDERSQEEFPNYEHIKRHLYLSDKEKRDNPDYDRSQEEFPSYVYKRYNDEDSGAEKGHWKAPKYHDKQYNEDFAQTTSQEKRFEEEVNKQYWNPLQQNHHKKHHKDDDEPSDEEIESKENDLNENNQRYENQDEQKRHYIDAEGRKQEKEAELKYLTKKLNEHLLRDSKVNAERNPGIYQEYYHPAWYKKSAEGPIGSLQKLRELANALQYKMSLTSEKEAEEEKPYHNQRVLSPEELKELEKLASVEQQAQMN